MRTKIASLPYLRIEHYDTATEQNQFSVNGFAYLILGQTILKEAPILELDRITKFAIGVQKELERLGIEIRRTAINVTIPEIENPRILWYAQ